MGDEESKSFREIKLSWKKVNCVLKVKRTSVRGGLKYKWKGVERQKCSQKRGWENFYGLLIDSNGLTR